MPHKSYEDIFCQERKEDIFWIQAALSHGTWQLLCWWLINRGLQYYSLTSAKGLLSSVQGETKAGIVTCGWCNTHLWLNADFDDTANDGENVADDEEDIPAVNELQPVTPAHFAVQSLLKEVHKLLAHRDNKRGINKDFKHHLYMWWEVYLSVGFCMNWR